MTRDEKVTRLIRLLKEENPGYAVIEIPDGPEERRRLLRSLMNVRWPGEASPEYLGLQDELLQEEAREKGIVQPEEIPAVWETFPEAELRNGDRIALWQGDITRLAADAIVNAANSQLLGCFVPCHGCIDNAIHSAAGIQLRNECARIMEEEGREEKTGQARITAGYNLPARHVIHTVGPVVGQQVTDRQKEELRSCYQSCLKLADQEGLSTIAFCCISTGEFHFPNKLAAQIALDTIDRCLSRMRLSKVIINVFKDEDLHIYQKLIHLSETDPKRDRVFLIWDVVFLKIPRPQLCKSFPFPCGVDQFFRLVEGGRKIGFSPFFPGLFLLFDLGPVGQDFLGIGNFHRAEHMGVTTDHFIHDGLDHVVHGEETFFFGDLGVHNDLQQKIAQFFFEILRVPCLIQDVDPADHLGGLFDAAFLQACVGLLPVPGASVGGAQAGDDGFKFFEFCHVRNSFLFSL